MSCHRPRGDDTTIGSQFLRKSWVYDKFDKCWPKTNKCFTASHGKYRIYLQNINLLQIILWRLPLLRTNYMNIDEQWTHILWCIVGCAVQSAVYWIWINTIEWWICLISAYVALEYLSFTILFMHFPILHKVYLVGTFRTYSKVHN